MLLDETARPSKGSQSSDFHIMPKKASVWFPCGDYRTLNTLPSRTATPFDTYTTTHTISLAAPSSQISNSWRPNTNFSDIEKAATTSSFSLVEFPDIHTGEKYRSTPRKHFSSTVHQWSCTVTHPPENHDHMSQHPAAADIRLPAQPASSRHQKNGLTHFPTLLMVGHTERLPHLGTSLSALPAV